MKGMSIDDLKCMRTCIEQIAHFNNETPQRVLDALIDAEVIFGVDAINSVNLFESEGLICDQG